MGARILLQQRNEAAKAAAESVAMEMDSESEEEGEERDEAFQMNDLQDTHPINAQKHASYEVTQPAPAAPLPSNVVIRDYDPKKGILFLPILKIYFS